MYLHINFIRLAFSQGGCKEIEPVDDGMAQSQPSIIEAGREW